MELSIIELQALLRAGNEQEQNIKSEYIGNYVICRTYSAGVHAGILKSHNSRSCVLHDSRRIWYWEGAASLSEMAMSGVSKPDKCKFPCAVDSICLMEVIEIILCTEIAEKSIRGVPVWTIK
jgi:hypothetical protein